jgi:lysozyme
MNRERVAEQLLVDEGLRLKPYRCTAGRLTIGVGRNLDDKGISHAEALVLLQNDLDEAWGGLHASLPWISAAPEAVQEALVNMAFNLGLKGLLGFAQTLELLRLGRYAEAATGMLASRWAGQVGARAQRLAAMVRSAGAAQTKD